MCSRADKCTVEELEAATGLKVVGGANEKGGIASPTDQVAVITDEQPNIIQYFQWRLIPNWAKGEWKATTMNIRSEEVEGKPSFRHLLGKRHCVIIFKSFYESSAVFAKKKKQHYRFSRTDGKLMYFAGLWDRWTDNSGIILNSCANFTLDVNEFMEKYHDRMPAILVEDEISTWLNPSLSWNERKTLIKKFPDDLLAVDKADDDIFKRPPTANPLGEQGQLPF